MKKFSETVFILIALVSLFGLQMFAKQDPKVQKKDTLKKEVKVIETLQEDSLIVPKGKYKIFKKTAHASYYADKFHGRRTASGKKYDKNGLTAAHKTLPFGLIGATRSPCRRWWAPAPRVLRQRVVPAGAT